MRFLAVVGLLAIQSVPLLAQIQGRIEYGKPRELYNARTVYVWTGGDAALEAEVRRQFSELLPILQFAETEYESDVTLSVQRKELPTEEADAAPKVLTTARLARGTASTIRIFADANSRAEDATEAVAEVLHRVATLFQRANPGRFGKPARDNRAFGKPKSPTVLTTAGLHPGMTKKDVLAAIGGPSKIDAGHGFTSTWMYDTTDGTMRLVFGGDRLLSVAFVQK
jgi:hypothetical protein